MKSTPFNPKEDYEPIPFDPEICQLAQDLKKNGLDWTPHVGCFVWDPAGKIPVPSPFPHRIYFILNLNHFLKIFDTMEQLKEHLVWLPTWHQARKLCDEMKIGYERFREQLINRNEWNSREETTSIYSLILARLVKEQIISPESHNCVNGN